MKIKPNDIFTPQGRLEDVQHNPNLDFLMNIFNIPRAFAVSGFGGNWNVGQHSVATALIALFWSNFNNYHEEKRNKLVTLSLLHDLHESVTGDILPMFKTNQVKEVLHSIQINILNSLGVKEEESLKVDLKVIDLIAFLYEIRQVSPNVLHSKKLSLANTMASRQYQTLLSYSRENGIAKEMIIKFISSLSIEIN